MILTPIVLKKLHEVPLEVRVWNGNFNRCEVERTINRRHYRIVVNDAHLLVHQFVPQSVISTPVEVWYNHRMVGEPVPEELNTLINKMQSLCKMQEDQARRIYQNMLNALQQFHRDFY